MTHNPSAKRASSGTDIILGGLGTLGLLTAEWLVRSGSQSLNLVGRRGQLNVAAAQAIEGSIRSAMITLTMCDASVWSDGSALQTGVGTVCLLLCVT